MVKLGVRLTEDLPPHVNESHGVVLNSFLKQLRQILHGGNSRLDAGLDQRLDIDVIGHLVMCSGMLDD